MKPKHKSIETKFMEERREFFQALKKLDRRSFLKGSAATAGLSRNATRVTAPRLSTATSMWPIGVLKNPRYAVFIRSSPSSGSSRRRTESSSYFRTEARRRFGGACLQLLFLP